MTITNTAAIDCESIEYPFSTGEPTGRCNSRRPPEGVLMSDTRDADLQRASLTRKLTGIIDVHSHIILDLGTGRDAGTGIPIEMMPPWSVESTLSLMDTHGIAACVLSVPEAASSTESAKACEIARRTNESLAKIVAQHPTRFGAMATIPGRTMD